MELRPPHKLNLSGDLITEFWSISFYQMPPLWAPYLIKGSESELLLLYLLFITWSEASEK